MRRALSIVLPLALVACARNTSGFEPGAAAPQVAVQQFLAAAKAQDIQAMGAVWGNADKPMREFAPRQEYERRLLIMLCHLRHDESRIGEPTAGEGGRMVFRVELKQGAKAVSPSFTTVKNTRSGRWFVEDFDFASTRVLCANPTGAPTGAPAAPRPPGTR